MEEVWKDVDGYEGLYQVSNHGRVKRVASNRCKKERILKQTVGTNGYYCVVLSKEGCIKTKKVHRLVACAFISNTNNLPQVSHIDENRLNNFANNLIWATNIENANMPLRKIRCSKARIGKRASEETKNKMKLSYNREKAYYYGRKSEDFSRAKKVGQYSINGIFIASYGSLKTAQEATNVAYTHISDCCRNKRKTAGGYIWKYI